MNEKQNKQQNKKPITMQQVNSKKLYISHVEILYSFFLINDHLGSIIFHKINKIQVFLHEFKSWTRLIAFSHSTNTLGIGMNPISLPPAMGK